MMQRPAFHCPEVWSSAPNCITESAENLLIVLFRHCLSYRCVFMMHNSTDIKEHSITLILLCTCRALFGLGDSGCFHCDDCAFVSGSYPYTHVSSPVITMFRNSGSVLVVSSRSCATSTRSSFCSADSSLGTNFAATLRMFKSARKISCAESLLIPTSLAISRTVNRQSPLTRFSTLSTTAAFRAVCGLPNAVHSPLMCGHF